VRSAWPGSTTRTTAARGTWSSGSGPGACAGTRCAWWPGCPIVAPSTGLRTWFGHDPQKWAEFRRRYRAELDEQPEAWRPLLEAVGRGDVTLLYSARDREHNNAVVLAEYLRSRRAGG
jgi:uncharacterized protein YeaO (DUF488 family)